VRNLFSNPVDDRQPGRRYQCSIRDAHNQIELSFNGGFWDPNNSSAAHNPAETKVVLHCSRLEMNFLGLHRLRNIWTREFGNPVMKEGNWHGVSLITLRDQRIFAGISSAVFEIDLSDGATIWETETANTTVDDVMLSQDGESLIVYNSYYQFSALEGLGNIAALDREGCVKWRVELPYPNDVFCNPPRYIDGTLTAYTWNGHVCSIDDAFGKIIRSHWTK
jgi:outer membrane protein assembly factor BamB